MSNYIGNFAEDAVVYFQWNTNAAAGGSITRSTAGTIKVYRDDGTDCTGTSISDTLNTPDTGIHHCAVNTGDNANFAVAHDYFAWVDGAVIDGQTVNACIAHFAIENRFAEVDVTKIAGAAVNTAVAQLGVNVVSVAADAITAAAIANGAIDVATFNTDVGSTVLGSNNFAKGVAQAVIGYNLDHLMLTPVANGADMTTEVPDGTVLSNIMTKAGDTSSFVRTTDSLEGQAEVLATVTTTKNINRTYKGIVREDNP